nr:MAG TPA: hypothetical protein [Caudoviricetes sp.]
MDGNYYLNLLQPFLHLLIPTVKSAIITIDSYI